MLTINFITHSTAKTEKEATARLVKSLVPGFNPSFTIVGSKRIYDLLPEKITLVKYSGSQQTDETVTPEEPGGETGGSETQTPSDGGEMGE